MHMRHLSRMASCLILVSFVFGGCAPAAAPTPTAKPAAPAPTQPLAPTAVPKVEATPNAKVATTPATGAPTAAPAADKPRYGGVLNRRIRSEPPTFDLHTESSSIVQWTLCPAYSGLLQYDGLTPGKIVPDLAEKWTVSGDGLTLTFNLRNGVKWHDGTPFTSADVVISLERLKKHPTVSSGLVPVKTIEAPDAATVKVTLNYPSAAILNYLALSWSAIFPKHIIDRKGNMKTDLVGTGAFKLKQFNRGVSITLEKDPAYLFPGKPYLDAVRTFFIADEAAWLAAMRVGQLDIVRNPSDTTAMTIRESLKDFKAEQVRMGQWRCIYLPIAKAPWSDIRVRKAVHLTMDRQAANKVIMGGLAEMGSQIPETMGGIPASEVIKRPGYRQPKDEDIAEAKKLMAEAGFPNGFKTSTLYRNGTEYEIQAVFMQDQLAKLGIEVAIKTVDDATFYDLRAKRAYDTFCHRRPLAVGDADNILMMEYKTGSSDNWSDIADPELDKLIDQQSREQDQAKRKVLVRQLNEKIEEMYTTIMLTWGGYWRAWGPKVRGYVLPEHDYDDEKLIDVWLAS